MVTSSTTKEFNSDFIISSTTGLKDNVFFFVLKMPQDFFPHSQCNQDFAPHLITSIDSLLGTIFLSFVLNCFINVQENVILIKNKILNYYFIYLCV